MQDPQPYSLLTFTLFSGGQCSQYCPERIHFPSAWFRTALYYPVIFHHSRNYCMALLVSHIVPYFYTGQSSPVYYSASTFHTLAVFKTCCKVSPPYRAKSFDLPLFIKAKAPNPIVPMLPSLDVNLFNTSSNEFVPLIIVMTASESAIF